MCFLLLWHISRELESPLFHPESTVKTIRGLTEEDNASLKVEGRTLRARTMDLKRPVKYFWSPQDLVLGIRDALRGALVVRILLSIAH